MIRRAAPTVVMVGVLVGAALAALGRPDFGAAGRFLSGDNTSTTSVLAIVGIMAWLVIGVAAAVALGHAMHGVATESLAVHQRWTRALLFLVTGAVVLGLGLVHHATTGFSVCCGNVQEASQLAR